MPRGKKKQIALRYVGEGATLHAVPARDLTEEEAVNYAIAFLVGTGLYELVKPAPAKRAEPTVKPEEDIDDGRS